MQAASKLAYWQQGRTEGFHFATELSLDALGFWLLCLPPKAHSFSPRFLVWSCPRLGCWHEVRPCLGIVVSEIEGNICSKLWSGLNLYCVFFCSIVGSNSKGAEMSDLEGMGESENSCGGSDSFPHMKQCYFSKRLHPVHNSPPKRRTGSSRARYSRGLSVAEFMALYPPQRPTWKAVPLSKGDTHNSNVGPADDDCTLVFTKPPPSPKHPPPA